MLMLKANAYGFHDCAIAHATKDIVNCFGVCTVEEGIALRECGIDCDILVMCAESSELPLAIGNNLIISLHNFTLLDSIISLANSNVIDKRDIRVHLKVDSGMHRFGFQDCDLQKAVETLKNNCINVEGVFSHLRDDSDFQRDEFERLSGVVLRSYPNAKRHIVSSHSLQHKSMRYDMVRVGLNAYHGAMRITSNIISFHDVKAGQYIGYGNYVTPIDTRVATVFGGYADGIFDIKRVWIDGRECNIVGNICMDSFLVDVGNLPLKEGDTVTIVDSEHLEEVISDKNTKEYNIYTNTFGRIKRLYYDKG